jgi:hypothetical protein
MEKEYLGIEDSLKYLVNSVKELKKNLIDLKAKTELRSYSLKEIAEGFGYKVQTFRDRPWQIPNYGKPDVDLHPARWYYNTIENWYAIPEDERRFKWESMSSRERLEAMGRASKKKITA